LRSERVFAIHAGGFEFVGDAALLHEREAFLGKAALAGLEALLGEFGGGVCGGEEFLENACLRAGFEDSDRRLAHLGDEETLVVSNLAHRAEDIETPRLSSQRQSRGEGECLAQADGERPCAVVAKGDIAEAGEFEFGVRPTPGLGETALRFQGGEACGLEVAVVGESGLDQ
jgi:hypothetical protein